MRAENATADLSPGRIMKTIPCFFSSSLSSLSSAFPTWFRPLLSPSFLFFPPFPFSPSSSLSLGTPVNEHGYVKVREEKRKEKKKRMDVHLLPSPPPSSSVSAPS